MSHLLDLLPTDTSVELRPLMSAPDAPTAWDLRCEVREELVRYLQDRQRQGIPQTRVALVHADGMEGPWMR